MQVITSSKPISHSDMSPQGTCQLELWSDSHTMIGLVTLNELLKNWLKPGVAFFPKNEPVKGEAPAYPH